MPGQPPASPAPVDPADPRVSLWTSSADFAFAAGNGRFLTLVPVVIPAAGVPAALWAAYGRRAAYFHRGRPSVTASRPVPAPADGGASPGTQGDRPTPPRTSYLTPRPGAPSPGGPL